MTKKIKEGLEGLGKKVEKLGKKAEHFLGEVGSDLTGKPVSIDQFMETMAEKLKEGNVVDAVKFAWDQGKKAATQDPAIQEFCKEAEKFLSETMKDVKKVTEPVLKEMQKMSETLSKCASDVGKTLKEFWNKLVDFAKEVQKNPEKTLTHAVKFVMDSAKKLAGQEKTASQER